MRYFLVDNGSLRAESVRNLRKVAGKLAQRSGETITPASLLHSNRIDPAELDGEKAVNLERRLRECWAAGERRFGLIPFFFGPTGAITQYWPERLAFLREHLGPVEMERTGFLFEAQGRGLVDILEERVEEVRREKGIGPFRVILVDHGSPLPEVAAVRNLLAGELRRRLAGRAEAVAAASMERREGAYFAFNEPLLERILREPEWNTGDVIVSLLFLSPGRHAGSGGDIAEICREAEAEVSGLRTHRTALVGDHPSIVPLLEKRLHGDRVPL